jgi:SAM-dependent methyltransferase
MLKTARKLFFSTVRIIVPPRIRPMFDPIRRWIRWLIRTVVPSKREEYRLGSMIGPIGYWQEMQDYQLYLLKEMGLRPHHTLLDIGCGPLSGGLAFIPYLDTGNYYGVDLRDFAIEEAHRQVAKAGLEDKKPNLAVSSTFGEEELEGARFDYVWMSQTSYHLDDDLMRYCIESIAGRLRPGGAFYADFISDPNQFTSDSHWFEYSFNFHSVEKMVELGAKYRLEVSNLGRIENFRYPVGWNLKNNYLLEFRAPPS